MTWSNLSNTAPKSGICWVCRNANLVRLTQVQELGHPVKRSFGLVSSRDLLGLQERKNNLLRQGQETWFEKVPLYSAIGGVWSRGEKCWVCREV
jgi:hypothetical protein